ncbi:kelch-like protein 31 [Ptychodera flava]|uniref:kelch-like protein 31 n=1 Tax=Ptychodera flava TaxID=63121 RepID=UPI00396A873F
MKRLIKMCTDFLRNFDFEHCLTALYIADRAGLKDVYTEILGFVTENFLEVANLEEFLRYPPERLTRLLADDDLCVENEIQVFHVALQWIEANGEMGMRYAPAIMKQIRFGLMSPEEIVQNVESVNFLMDLPECHVLILEAFRYFSLRACHKGSLRPHPINPRKGMNKVRNARRASIAIPDEIVSHGKKILGVPTPFALASKIGSREDSELTSTGGLVKIEPVTVQKPLQENRPALSPDKECILCSGGINTVADVDNPGRMVNCFDPLQNSWSKLTEMPYPRNHHAAQFVNGYLYIIGGSDPNAESEEFMSPMSTACRYDIASKKWEDIAPMKTSRVFFQVAVLYGQLYVVGGQDAKGRILSSVERYDSATNTWRYTASLSSPRYAVSVAPHRGMLFAVGGYNDNGKTPVLSTVECYDPHSDLWTEKSPLRYARCHASMADVVGKLYLFGGMVKTNSSDEDCRSLPSVDVYIDNDDTWEYVTDLSEARHESSVAVMGTKVFIIGGISAMEKQVLSSVECYDALTGQWQSPNVPSLPRPAFGHSCCVMTIKQS